MGPVPVPGGLHRLGERRVRNDDIQQTVQAHEVSVRDQISGGSVVAGSRLLAGQREGPDTWDAPGFPGYDPGVTAAPATGREAPAARRGGPAARRRSRTVHLRIAHSCAGDPHRSERSV
ncbi:hypothetical protein GCM10010284_51350 [Streptomyces rubiginosohelvolus]|uniref:Uncharacterized protein n=1 Tax=Streptomyces rubiginosohelvolus TaxID=67362 RepID=A0ABQ3CEV0_9ACTN|nr:hypothetical protein GCM10010284_51350 [Streptomyces rubiginosohelvolus]GGZ75066.1 hypothetical protein GCM10010328_57500 [Streptomyces pluricolorescens]